VQVYAGRLFGTLPVAVKAVHVRQLTGVDGQGAREELGGQQWKQGRTPYDQVGWGLGEWEAGVGLAAGMHEPPPGGGGAREAGVG